MVSLTNDCLPKIYIKQPIYMITVSEKHVNIYSLSIANATMKLYNYSHDRSRDCKICLSPSEEKINKRGPESLGTYRAVENKLYCIGCYDNGRSTRITLFYFLTTQNL